MEILNQYRGSQQKQLPSEESFKSMSYILLECVRQGNNLDDDETPSQVILFAETFFYNHASVGKIYVQDALK